MTQARRLTPVSIAVLPLIWLTVGSAFVALKVGVTDVPPFLFSGSRFVLVGLILLGWSAWRTRGRLALTRTDVAISAATGAGMIMAGQGGASWATQYLNPGIVATLSSTMPLWAAVLSLIAFRSRLGPLAVLGLLAGFAGVAVLAWPAKGAVIPFLPALVVSIGSVAWAAGALLVSRSDVARRPVLMTSIQMLVGGGLQVLLGLAGGETAALTAGHVAQVLPVFVYLVVVPGLIGFPLLTWLLRTVELHIANSVAYAVPVVALGLGWLLLGEQISMRTLACIAVILAGVALLIWSGRRPASETQNHRKLEEQAA